MSSAKSIINKLVAKGLLLPEYADVAASELHTEMTRRSKRVARTLAAMAEVQQLALHFAEAHVIN